MTSRRRRPKAGSRHSRGQTRNKVKTRAVKLPKAGRPTSDLDRVLWLIREHPGIRPSEINRLLNLEQSDGLRNTLIRRGLIRKERDGSAMRYYLV